MKNLLKKIEDAALVGRGGASYPVAWKWQAVLESLKKSDCGYIVANGAEGEPGLKKDGYVLNKHLADFILGLNLMFQFLGEKKIKKVYIFLNKDYYKEYSKKIISLLENKEYSSLGKKVELFLKPIDSGYIGGEETAILNIIEGKKAEPRFRPPFPASCGLFSKPTLVHNIETIYNISLVSKGEYREERLYTILGAVKKPGVYRFPALMNIEDVLKNSSNYPDFKFFAQIGGNASGEILNQEQLNIPAENSASIMIYDQERTSEKKLIEYWLNFYFNNSCGQCVTCREGTYRLQEMVKAKSYDEKVFWQVVAALDDSSFCALGSSLPVPLLSYYRNIKNIDPLMLA